MNRLKGAFDEGFQELKNSERKVKQTVINSVNGYERPAPKKFPKAVAVFVAIFAISIVGILAAKYMQPEQQASIIDEKYFEMVLYENYELSPYFYNEANAKALTYYKYVSDLAAIDYIENVRELTIYEERLETLATENQEIVNSILAEQQGSWMHGHLHNVQEKFGIDLEQYFQYQKEIQQKSHVAREMIEGLLHNQLDQDRLFDSLDELIMPDFAAKYAEQLRALREKYDINPDYEFKPQGENASYQIGDVSYETVIVNGRHVLKEPFRDVSNINFQIEAVRMEIERSEGFTLFCYETLDDYKRGAERFIKLNRMVEEAEVFLQAIELLRNTAEYD